MLKDNTRRFSDRVDNYTKYRPSYPNALIEYINNRFEIYKKNIIVDIGSGTGKLSELLIPISKQIVAVEPNDKMRSAAESKLTKYNNYKSVNGTVENTTLKDRSIDLITIAQAFHWFNIDKAKKEFQRILKSDGSVLIIANMRLFNTPFLQEYEKALNELIPEYKEVNHYRINSDVVKSFYNSNYEQKVFQYNQTFDWCGILGRLSSSSYTPKKDTKEYIRLGNRIKEIFIRYSKEGKVVFNYESIVLSGKIN